MSALVSYSDSEGEDEESTKFTALTENKEESTLRSENNTDFSEPFLKSNSKNNTDYVVPVKDELAQPPNKKLKTEKQKSAADSLPLPSSIKSLFATKVSKRTTDEQKKHDGRIRSFAHEEGNWATFVYIPAPEFMVEKIQDLQNELQAFLNVEGIETNKIDDLHVTLSRTVTIRHHWIDSLMDSLRKNLSSCLVSEIVLSHLKVYTNDEKTRTFLAVECVPTDEISSYVSEIDNSFKEFRLQEYYQDPSFHISVCWMLGDKCKETTARIPNLQNIWDKFLEESAGIFDVNELICKTGNKIFSFALMTG